MCGIFGGMPKNKKSLNIAKLKLLGRENVTRGRDSCGYYYGGVVRKGVDKEKEFDDFIKANIIEKGDLYPAFLGHTRSASPGMVGGYSAVNAHPFEFDDLVLTHNGIIYNIDDLIKKYNVDPLGLNVDSHKLGKIIHDKGLDVLNDYVGHAALAFVQKSNPETCYLYHGKSKEMLQGRASEGCYEERPLNYMETKEGLYYSSEKDPLLMIRDSEDEVPKTLPYNKVFKVVNGIILSDEKDIFVVNREENNINIDDFKTKTTYYGNQQNFFPKGGSSKNNKPDPKVVNLYELPERSLIWKEKLPRRATVKTNICFFWKGRFWIKKDSVLNIDLAHGLFHLNKKGEIGSSSSFGTKDYYFYNGVMMKSAAVYHSLVSEVKAGISSASKGIVQSRLSNPAYYLSKYSIIPVVCLEEEGQEVFKTWKQKWFIDQRDPKLTTTINPKFSSRSYHIENSYLISIKSSDKNDKEIYENDSNVVDNHGNTDSACDIPPHKLLTQGNINKFNDRRQKVKLSCNAIFDDKDFILRDNFDTLWVVTEMVKDLFRVDYNFDISNDSEAIQYNVELFILECVNSGITIMENFPENYELDKYLDSFELYLTNLFDLADDDNVFDDVSYEDVDDTINNKKKLKTMNKIIENENKISELDNEIESQLYFDILTKKFEEISDVTTNLRNLADAFQSLDSNENDDFVNDVALQLYKANENMATELNNLILKYNLKIQKVQS